MPFAFGIDTLQPAFPDRPIPYITYGSRFHLSLAEHVANTLDASRVYLIVSSGLATKTPSALQRVRDALGSKLVGTRVGMKPHTHWDEVVEVANDARGHDPDCIVTLGAGSLTDAAKVIAWMLANDVTTSQDLEGMWTGSPVQRPATDLKPSVIRTVAIPTSLSGGEYQALAGVTRDDGSHRKCPFYPPARNPSLVILDPELCTTTPESIWLSTGIRAVDHCIETLCSLKSNEKADESAARGLTRLLPGLLRTKQDPSDLDARFETQMGVVDAMDAVASGVPLGASHAIGHQLGPLGVGHGETSCIMLPAVCKWNLQQNANVERQVHCRNSLLRHSVIRDLVQNKIPKELETKEIDLGDILDLVIRELGLPRSLNEVGVGSDKLDALAENTLSDPWARTNAEPLERKEQVLEILHMVLLD